MIKNLLTDTFLHDTNKFLAFSICIFLLNNLWSLGPCFMCVTLAFSASSRAVVLHIFRVLHLLCVLICVPN